MDLGDYQLGCAVALNREIQIGRALKLETVLRQSCKLWGSKYMCIIPTLGPHVYTWDQFWALDWSHGVEGISTCIARTPKQQDAGGASYSVLLECIKHTHICSHAYMDIYVYIYTHMSLYIYICACM